MYWYKGRHPSRPFASEWFRGKTADELLHPFTAPLNQDQQQYDAAGTCHYANQVDVIHICFSFQIENFS